MTRLIVPITAPTFELVKAEVLRARGAGADMVELRLDCMDGLFKADFGALRTAAAGKPPLLFTPRSPEEGGTWRVDDGHRLARISELRDCADWWDLELATWDRCAAKLPEDVREVVGRLWGAGGASLILSSHDFGQRPRDLCRLVERMNETPECQVVKVVFQARHISECFELFDLMRSNPKPVIAIAMGEAGLITRILAKKFGAFGTFASLEPGKESAPGQVTIEEMRGLYRWDAVNADTAVYGVIGNPVGHSMSPAILNAAFEQCGVNAVYVPLLVEPEYVFFEDFLRQAMVRPWFGLRGCSVTIPHKANALRFVREDGGFVEPLAERIGAVNTLALDGGKVSAYNTDYAGALDALTDALGCERGDLRDVEAAVLGAGGVSRAVVAGLRDCGCRVTIYNRTAERARQLADEFGCTAAPNEERVRPGTRIVVNCTSIGMHPNPDETPLPADRLRADMTVFDTVYNPIDTRFLREARQVGCRTVDGVAMFANQAAAQYERWTGRPAPRDLMREVVVRRLTGTRR